MAVRIFSYNQGSQGSKELAAAMPNVKRIKKEGSKFVGGPQHTIINWGSGTLPDEICRGSRIINNPNCVRRMSNKLTAFQHLEGHCRIPPWTTDRGTASLWLERDKKKVFARTVVNGHSGAGIELMDPEHPDTWNIRAPLYVQYVPKRHEYRVHIVNGQVIDTQRKGLREGLDREGVNWMVRNLLNGFIYVRNDGHVVPEDVFTEAKKAMVRSELNFGAVDVIYNESAHAAYVLEINTAPGLSGTTVENYARALSAL